MRTLYWLILVGLLTSCATSNQSIQSTNLNTSSQKGMTAATLQAKLGTPNITNTLPNGNKVYIYTTQTYQSYPASPTSGVQTFRTAGGLPIVVGTPQSQFPPVQAKCTKAYEVNKQGVVIGVKTSGC